MSEVEQVEYSSLLIEGKEDQALEYLQNFVETSFHPFPDDKVDFNEKYATVLRILDAHSHHDSR